LPSLMVALSDLGDEMPIRSPGMFELDPLTNAWWLVYFGLRREPSETARFDIVRQAISTSQGLALPTEIVSMEERSQDRQSRGHEFLLTEEHAAELRQLCVAKYKASLDEARFLENPRLATFLWRWSEWGTRDEVRRWIERKTQTPEGALWFLLVALGERHSWGADHRVRYFISLSFVERFADAERIRALTGRLNRGKLSKREQIALRELDKAFARRAEGKPDNAWQSDFASKDDEIVE